MLSRWEGEPMGHNAKTGDRPKLITANEIACFAYCLEQWRLQYRLGLAAESRQAMNVGMRHHAGKAVAERVADGFIVIGRLVAVLAVVVLLLLWMFSR